MLLGNFLPQQEIMNYKNAQILLVTLLVLMIVAIVIIGIVIISNRDIAQVSTNQKYEQLYNVAEVEIQRVIEKYGDGKRSLVDLSQDGELKDFIQSCTPVNQNIKKGFDCEVQGNNTAGLKLDTTLEVFDTKEMKDLRVYKDESLNLILNGYNQSLNIYWDQGVALEFVLNFFIDTNTNNVWDVDEEIIEIRDIFDKKNIFTSKDQSNAFGFTPLTDRSGGVTLNINNISSLQSNNNYKTRSLALIPRTREDRSTPVILSVTPADLASFPHQLRVFNIETYDSEDENSPFIEINSKLSLEPNIDSIFNYSLITENDISF